MGVGGSVCGGDLVDLSICQTKRVLPLTRRELAARRAFRGIAPVIMVVPEEIWMACNMGEVATVEAWLDSGNDPDEVTSHGDTLLFAAAERGGPDMMRMLIARGATVDARDDDEDRRGTPLLTAAFEDNVRSMKILIESGANVNAQTNGGYSVLMEAVVSVYHKSIEPEDVLFLLRSGADYTLRNHRGDDAEAIAARGHEITQFVLADVRAAGGIKQYYRQPIVQLNVLRLLCERGRATAPSGVLARLFSDPSLPRELFAHVLLFWRSARALDEDRAFDRVRGRYLPARSIDIQMESLSRS